MRIGLVGYPSLGGSGVVASELAHQLVKRGHDVHFFAHQRPFRLCLKGLFFHPISPCTYPLFQYPDYALALAGKVAAIANDVSLDVLHVHYAVPHAVSAILAKKLCTDLRVVVTLHGTDVNVLGQDPSYREVLRWSLEECDAVTCVSRSLKQDVERVFALKQSVHVIYNFFSTRQDDVHDVRSQFASSDESLLLHVSNFRPVKRIKDVLEVFRLLRKDRRCRLLFLGEGPDREALQRRVMEQSLEKEIFFLDHVCDPRPYILASDLLLLPSAQESFGLAALEAQGLGTPVIGTKVGGLPEVVEHGVSGYLESVGDVQAMARRALCLLEDAQMYAKFSEQAKMRVRTLFNAELCVDKYLALY